MYIRSKRIYVADGCVSGIISVEDGKIADILNYNAKVSVDFEADAFRVLPGIIDKVKKVGT